MQLYLHVIIQTCMFASVENIHICIIHNINYNTSQYENYRFKTKQEVQLSDE